MRNFTFQTITGKPIELNIKKPNDSIEIFIYNSNYQAEMTAEFKKIIFTVLCLIVYGILLNFSIISLNLTFGIIILWQIYSIYQLVVYG